MVECLTRAFFVFSRYGELKKRKILHGGRPGDNQNNRICAKSNVLTKENFCRFCLDNCVKLCWQNCERIIIFLLQWRGHKIAKNGAAYLSYSAANKNGS